MRHIFLTFCFASCIFAYFPAAAQMGSWSALDPSLNAEVRGKITAMEIAANGDIYVAGSFTEIGGVANTKYIAKWDGSSWSAVHDPLPVKRAEIKDIALAPDGSGGYHIFLAGHFNLVQEKPLYSIIRTSEVDGYGQEDMESILKWNGTAWTFETRYTNCTRLEVYENPAGGYIVYAFAYTKKFKKEDVAFKRHLGQFRYIPAVSSFDVIKWEGSNWKTIGSYKTKTPLKKDFWRHDIKDMEVASNGDLYILRWNMAAISNGGLGTFSQWVHATSTWVDLSDKGNPSDLSISNSDELYATGSFPHPTDPSIRSSVGKLENGQFVPIGNIRNTGNYRAGIFSAPNGDLFVYNIGFAYEPPYPDVIPSIAQWNGSVWTPLIFNNPSSGAGIFRGGLNMTPSGQLIAHNPPKNINGLSVNGPILWTAETCPASNIIYVDQAATGTGNGSSWENAFVDLRMALDFVRRQQCPNTTSIWVADGTYSTYVHPLFPKYGLDSGYYSRNPAPQNDLPFYFLPGIAIYGGFAGASNVAGSATLSDRDPSVYKTILSANSYRLKNNIYAQTTTPSTLTLLDASLYTESITSTSIFDGFEARRKIDIPFGSPTVRNFTISHSGINISNTASPLFENCESNTVFSINMDGDLCSATIKNGNFNGKGKLQLSNVNIENSNFSGSGISFSIKNGTLDGCTFSGLNNAPTSYYYPNFLVVSGVSSFTNCVFRDYVTHASSFSSSSYLLNINDEATFESCDFLSNQFNSRPIIKANGNTAMINFNNCNFKNNVIRGYNMINHTGILSAGSNVSVNSCEFSDNQGTSIHHRGQGPLIISNTSFINNLTTTTNTSTRVSVNNLMEGATVYITLEGVARTTPVIAPRIFNCSFVHNNATSEIISINARNWTLSSYEPEIINCTITANTSKSGAAIYSSGASPKIINTIIFANIGTGTAPTGGFPQILVSPAPSPSATPTISYSVVQNGQNSSSTKTIKPELGTDGGQNRFNDPRFTIAPTLGSPSTPFDLTLNRKKSASTSKRSLLINKGDNSVNVGTVDVLGNLRRTKGNKNATAPIVVGTIDIGAYETQ